jgi:hypothetical protein
MPFTEIPVSEYRDERSKRAWPDDVLAKFGKGRNNAFFLSRLFVPDDIGRKEQAMEYPINIVRVFYTGRRLKLYGMTMEEDGNLVKESDASFMDEKGIIKNPDDPSLECYLLEPGVRGDGEYHESEVGEAIPVRAQRDNANFQS